MSISQSQPLTNLHPSPTPSPVPKSHLIWILISSPIILYECLFLLLRPQTMKGGDLFDYFSSFDLYVQIDPLFGDTENWFVTVLVIFNFSETIMNILGMLFYLGSQTRGMGKNGAGLLMFTAAGSFYKTLIFLVYDFWFFNWEFKSGVEVALVYVIPNLCWVGFPLVGMIRIFRRITATPQQSPIPDPVKKNK